MSSNTLTNSAVATSETPSVQAVNMDTPRIEAVAADNLTVALLDSPAVQAIKAIPRLFYSDARFHRDCHVEQPKFPWEPMDEHDFDAVPPTLQELLYGRYEDEEMNYYEWYLWATPLLTRQEAWRDFYYLPNLERIEKVNYIMDGADNGIRKMRFYNTLCETVPCKPIPESPTPKVSSPKRTAPGAPLKEPIKKKFKLEKGKKLLEEFEKVSE